MAKVSKAEASRIFALHVSAGVRPWLKDHVNIEYIVHGGDRIRRSGRFRRSARSIEARPAMVSKSVPVSTSMLREAFRFAALAHGTTRGGENTSAKSSESLSTVSGLAVRGFACF